MEDVFKTMTFRKLEIDDFEQVIEVKDTASGLHAIIAIHNTRLGPALGGIRAYPYTTFQHALTDVLRLSKGMTYKSALAQTGTGGGKSVIILDPSCKKSEDLLLAFASAVNYFQGQYICAEDVGMSIHDLEVVGRGTKYAVGLPSPQSSGDPSPFTAFGGFLGIKATCKQLWGSESLRGRTIAIQGLGSVGMKLAQSLFWEGASLVVADVNPLAAQKAAREFGAQVVSPEDILKVECEILAPCALGGIINSETIPYLKCEAIAGLANNQLLTDEDGVRLTERGILYAPDFIINGGGLINVCQELKPEGYCSQEARDGLNRIYHLLLDVYQHAEENDLPTHHVAMQIADKQLLIGHSHLSTKELLARV